jgi:hypothetical protein
MAIIVAPPEEHRQFLDRKAFMKLPVEERRKILEEQSKAMQKHYDELAEPEKPGGGDFLDAKFDSARKLAIHPCHDYDAQKSKGSVDDV